MKKLLIIALCSLSVAVIAPLHSQELLNYPLDTVNGEEVYKYEVEKSIGLYRIGVNFGVSQNEIIRLNPQLRERGLHYGETLLIPTGRPVVIESKPKVVKTIVTETKVFVPKEEIRPVIETTVVAEEPMRQDTVSAVDTMIPSVPSRKVVELALMLPFESQQTKRSGNAERMMEFYQGALLALHDLQNDSTLYRLRVYDTERSELRVKALCDSTVLDSVRGVLGLVYPMQIERMAEWCDVHRVPLLLPFSDDINLTKRPHIYQFNSPDADKAKALTGWMKSQDSTAHFIVVEVRESDMSPSVRVLRRTMRAEGLVYDGLPMHDLMVDSCDYMLDAEKENVFILHSDRYQHVRMLIPHIIKLQQAGYSIRLVSQYSWQKEEIGLKQVYTSMFKSDIPHEAYDALWAQTYAGGHVSEAPRYDLLGYDLMNELVRLVTRQPGLPFLQSPITWESASEQDGWQNTQIQVIER